MTTDQRAPVEREALLRPIIGIENRTAQEAFDIMCDRMRYAMLPVAGSNCPKCGHRHPASYKGPCVNCGAEEPDLSAFSTPVDGEEGND